MKTAVKVVVPFLLIAVGVAVAYALIHAKPKAQRVPPPPSLSLVDVVVAEPVPASATVEANGEVVPSETVTVVPQVGGRIVQRSAKLIPGGRLAEGERLLRIDPREFELAIRQQESSVRQARLDLELEEGRKQVAEREWELLGDGRSREEAPLALRGPQLEAAKVNLEAAESALERARLDLDRSEIRAPFDALVVSASVDEGQVVTAGSQVAEIVGTDRFWVRASVPVERLSDLEIPGYNGQAGSAVTVAQDLGQTEKVVREGRVIGLAGGLDTETRTAQILIAVDDPLDPPEGERPLLHGAFVTLSIYGRERSGGAFVLPRAALVGGDTVWAVDDEDRLEPRPVRIGWSDRESIYVVEGLTPGERIVTTPLALPVAGEQVEVRRPDDPAAIDGAGANGETADE